MDFILIINAGDNVNLEALRSTKATSYQAKSFDFSRFQHLQCFTYHYDTWLKGEGVQTSDDYFHLLKGVAIKNVDSNPLAPDTSKNLIGDYLQITINDAGKGEVNRPFISFHRLFYFNDGESQILASDAKLIIRAIKQYSDNPLSNNFNQEFILDAIEHEWIGRKYDDGFFLRGIQRVLPTDKIYCDNFKFFINKQNTLDTIPIDSAIATKFLENKESYYHDLMISIDNSAKSICQNQSFSSVKLNLSGGLDSRLALAVLFKLQKELDFEIHLQSSGPDDHPDVVIASKLAEVLNLPFKNNAKRYTSNSVPKSQKDYIDCFSSSLGDWNSNNFRISKNYITDIELLGVDNFKRTTLSSMSSLNRWFASRIANIDLLPILSLYEINQHALLCNRFAQDIHDVHHEFAYYLINYFCPEIQEVPYAGQSLKQLTIKPYKTVRDSKVMPSDLVEAYYDPVLIKTHLGFVTEGDGVIKISPLSRLLRKVASKFNRYKIDILIKKIGVYRLDTEQKKRIAMDFSSVAETKGCDL